jgi:hypothetical protein
MNDLPRQKLCELIAQHGPQLCDDRKRCRNLLREQCGAFKEEIRALDEALREDVADELRAAPGAAPPERVARLTRQLQQELDWNEDVARWAVESWALALNVITPADLTPPPAAVAGPRSRRCFPRGHRAAGLLLPGPGV